MSADKEIVPAANLRLPDEEPQQWGNVPFKAIEAIWRHYVSNDDGLTMEFNEIGNWIGVVKAIREGRYEQ